MVFALHYQKKRPSLPIQIVDLKKTIESNGRNLVIAISVTEEIQFTEEKEFEMLITLLKIINCPVNIGCYLEDLHGVMTDRNGWLDRIKGICAINTIW